MQIANEQIAVVKMGAPHFGEILTPEAVAFVAQLERAVGGRRRELLHARQTVQNEIDNGRFPQFPPETAAQRAADWQVAPIPAPLQKRWVEITGPTDRKMVINALNSGADIFMADFEDANCPTWDNMVDGQYNLRDAVRGTISYTHPTKNKQYQLNEEHALLLVRPRGWHLEESGLLVDGQPVSASIFDFGLYFFHNAQTLLENGAGPYFYLPKLEHYLEARLWNDLFVLAQDLLNIPQGSIKATVLIETILAAFQMDEILYEIRNHAAGLNAGRWDYIFSAIKKFRNSDSFFPDRAQIGMTTPFMRAYTEKMIQTCHKRGAHAIGGMAAFIPSRKDEQVNREAFTKVRADKEREAADGCDGTWVAHPDLVPLAREIFTAALDGRPHQKEILRAEVAVTAADLVNFNIPDAAITEQGLRTNINVALLYLESWLNGQGAAALYNLMEDTATAEISRAQIWQWVRHPQALLTDGRAVNIRLYETVRDEELAAIRTAVGDAAFTNGRYVEAATLLDQLVTDDNFADFLTLPGAAYL